MYTAIKIALLFAVTLFGSWNSQQLTDEPSVKAESKEKKLKIDVHGHVFEFVRIEPATFVMGEGAIDTPSGVSGALLNGLRIGSKGMNYEGPKRETTITRPYYILDTKISNKIYLTFLEQNKATPEHGWWFKDRFLAIQYDTEKLSYAVSIPQKMDGAVEGATWEGAMAFCGWLSRMTGRSIRLPTEAEWDLAARGVERRKYPWGNEEVAGAVYDDIVVGDKTPFKTMIPKKYPANATPDAVFDMCSFTEWCADKYAKTYDIRDSVDPIGPLVGDRYVMRGVTRSTLSRVGGTSRTDEGMAATYSFRVVTDINPCDQK